ncbi:MAG: response regulator, partial [Proteobacteria bacterium]
AKEEAESANHAKSAFLANMSHEIRTPLGVILGLTDLITANEIEADEWEEYTLAIRRNGEMLLKIINDILDISKVEAGRLELDNVETDVHELIEDLHTLLQFKADEKQLQFEVEAGEDLPSCILVDSLRLKQILFNVVGNALKFTDHGSVNLKVRRDTPSNRLLFDVVDTGPGLSNEQRERLFKPFTQAEASTTRKFGGSGLGLALSRQLALAMGGDLCISQSTPGEGTVFTLSLPIVAVNPKIARERRSEFSIASNGVSLDGLNVLVVDDSPDNLMLVSRILKKAGANVTTCEGGLKALDVTESAMFHVVLMDLQMPDMDGYRVTEILRKRGFAKPIFALTAHAFKEERIRCLQSGFDGHLIKPVDKDQLVKVLNSMAKRIHSDVPAPRIVRRLQGGSSQRGPML